MGHIEHPDWNSFTLSGDVAILYLDSPLEFSAEIDSISLAQSEPAVGEPVNMAGWGKTCDQFNCGVSDVVNEVTSFGSIFGCEVGAPACFTSIPNYLDWLNENGSKK